MYKAIDEAKKEGARLKKACELIGISIRTYQRWKKRDTLKDRREDVLRNPANKLSKQEKQKILDTCHSKDFRELPPCKIVPMLADRGIYIGSESTFYRVLREAGELTHRGRSKPRTYFRPKHYRATGPNQVWSWDITYLPSCIQGMFFYLYMYIDIYSHKIVGWEVYTEQRSNLATKVLKRALLKEKITGEGLVIHSDNGKPMKGSTMLATMQNLGIIRSFSRPHVSDDNPYIESLFKTVKYCPKYPGRFSNIEEARKWCLEFVTWYNSKHYHSKIKFVTPEQRHSGLDNEILAKRKEVYKRARSKHPERWSGNIRNWNPVLTVDLNPVNEQPYLLMEKMAWPLVTSLLTNSENGSE
ncbi:MAG: putative transposase [Desulfonauticus sp.]|nr:putative transposase [Desulfonauticus sp.]